LVQRGDVGGRPRAGHRLALRPAVPFSGRVAESSLLRHSTPDEPVLDARLRGLGVEGTRGPLAELHRSPGQRQGRVVHVPRHEQEPGGLVGRRCGVGAPRVGQGPVDRRGLEQAALARQDVGQLPLEPGGARMVAQPSSTPVAAAAGTGYLPAMGIEYREGEVDVAQLAALRARCDFSARSADELRQQLRGARWVVSAWSGSELVGLARALSDGITNAYVSSVMVDGGWRRRGIGRELMRRLMAGRPPQIRWVLHARAGAVDFYRALGFTAATGIMWRGRDATPG
jgi:ribosomal protein S18 acetylase RimI-like enzyme